jgi:hypothetical protein
MADQESEGPVLPEADKTMYFGRGEGSGVQTTMHNNGGITGYRPYVYRPYADTPMSGRDRQAETMTAEERANQVIQAIKDIDKWMPNFARELLGGRLDETIGTRGLWGQVNQIVDALTDTDSFNPAEDTIRIPALPPRSPPAGGGGPARRAGIGLWGRQQWKQHSCFQHAAGNIKRILTAAGWLMCVGIEK